MRFRCLVSPAWLVLAAICCAGCATDPEQLLVGKWAASNSPASVAIKATKLKHENPGLSGEKAMDYAKGMSAIAMELSEDKKCDLFIGGSVLHGTWKFDKVENIVELDLTTADLAPQADGQEPQPFQPKQWICELKPDDAKIELYQMDRQSYATIQSMRKTQKIPAQIVLRKT